MDHYSKKLFICFSAKDRYKIVQPVVYHLKNYGVDIWYDRYEMVMGDNRFAKNIQEGAGQCEYALIILSANTEASVCASEEIKVLESRYYNNNVVVFPVLYELDPSNIPKKFSWIKNIIFKEVDHTSGTIEICNHIACKITQDMIRDYHYRSLNDIINAKLPLPEIVITLLNKYNKIDSSNLNSRITMLYAIFIAIRPEHPLKNPEYEMPIKIFERLFAETLLNLNVDYRDIWLLENSLCLLINYYITFCIESKV